MNHCFKVQRKHELVQAYEHIFYGKKKKKKKKTFGRGISQFLKKKKKKKLKQGEV
jgi:hypothetical protein